MESNMKSNAEVDIKSTAETDVKSTAETDVKSTAETYIKQNTESNVTTNGTRVAKRKSQGSLITVLFLVLLIILLGLTLVWVTIDENALIFSRQNDTAATNRVALPEDLPANQMAQKIGTAIREYVNDENRDEVIATILGKEITAMHFNITAKLFELSGSEDPETDAWNAIKIQAFERNFAIERGIFPTEREINRFTQEMREMVESTPEGLEFSRILLEAAGMTEDEYWNNFRLIYESPAHLVSINVAAYRAENGWNDPTAEAIIRQVNEMIAAGNY